MRLVGTSAGDRGEPTGAAGEGAVVDQPDFAMRTGAANGFELAVTRSEGGRGVCQ